MDVSASDEGRRIVRTSRRLCPHCNQNVTFKTFKAHRRLYFDPAGDRWLTRPRKADSDLTASCTEMPADCDLPPTTFGENNMELDDSNDTPSHHYYVHDPDSVANDIEDTLIGEEFCSNDDSPEMWNESDEEDVITDIEPPNDNFTAREAVYNLSDAAASFLLKFLSILFGILARISVPCSSIAKDLPSSLYKLQQLSGGLKQFCRYVVCRKCDSVYLIEQCKERNNTSKKCPYVQFPDHRYTRMRQPCNTLLLKTVELSSGKQLLYPHLNYCYLSINNSLQSLLLRPSFLIDCEKWRNRVVQHNTLHDVYDGKIWSEFQVYNGCPFLSDPLSFAFTINLDWFKPFKHSNYSIGAMYMTIMNLPRDLRNKPENILLVGILPGPYEAGNINGFLKPLVVELNEFFTGKELEIFGCSAKKRVRCALLCASCDLPAGRKLCGFLSYTARQGCSRCLKSFPGSAGEMDYSGFDHHNWLKRNRVDHLKVATELQTCNTKAAIAKLESESGYRYTELLRLPYFHPERMLAIDPMHNLFLGSGKHILKDIWIELRLITDKQFTLIQNRVDKIVSPPDIGRIPNKIQSGFASFTADQHKNWILYFSLLALRDILCGEHLECWHHFVLACRLLCSKQITHDQITLADTLLLYFCERTERLYGKEKITPNMHMHAHLSECLRDYGPSHVFWLFSFERYNGILEDIPNNNRSIEIQLMKRFLENNSPLCTPVEFQEEFKPLFKSKRVVGTLSDNFVPPPALPPLSRALTESPLDVWCMNSHQLLPKHSQRGVFAQSEIDGLKLLYSELANVPSSSIEVPNAFLKYQQVTMYEKVLGSYKSRSAASSVVMAVQNPLTTERPAKVNYFAKHIVTISDTQYTFLLFHASWYKPHRNKDTYGKPITIWENDIYEIPDSRSIIPVQFITSRTVSLTDKLPSGESVLLVCPCVDF